MSESLDRLGAAASGLCAVHCAMCALLPAALGTLGMGVMLGERLEWVLTLFATAFAAAALGLGWRQHRSSRVAILLTLGILAVLASRAMEMGSHHEHEASGLELGTLVGVFGGLLLIAGHVANIRVGRRQAQARCQAGGDGCAG